LYERGGHVLLRHLARLIQEARRLPGVEEHDEALIYRTEVTAIIGALSDIIVELREIRELLEEIRGEEEEDEEDDS
jgi:hypothetical protein